MRRYQWIIILVLSLLGLSGGLYAIHYIIFHDSHHIFIYLLGDVAFVPIEVLLVTLIIHRLLSQREKRAILEKLNLVIGAFFSQVGTKALTYFSDFDPKLDTIRQYLLVNTNWDDQDFNNISQKLINFNFRIDIKQINLVLLRNLLITERDFLLRLLENPALLEHESFTKLLRAIFHLTEELGYREDLLNLPDSDYQHLTGDIERAYRLLVHEWLDYMKYLEKNYPFLFSLAMRTNPFDLSSSPVVN